MNLGDKARAQLQMMINLAVSDGHFSKEEQDWIYLVGTQNNLGREDIQQMIHESQPIGNLDRLNDEERFEILYSIVQLMKIDRVVHPKEVELSESMAEKLGYHKKVIQVLSSRIYSDPSITSDREKLKKLVQEQAK
ncbi:MAG: TerB family tellurite resistance protein [Cytophagales bacterium]|nr:TerB family tellurite resistance protein [Cytophagales bacterium]